MLAVRETRRRASNRRMIWKADMHTGIPADIQGPHAPAHSTLHQVKPIAVVLF